MKYRIVCGIVAGLMLASVSARAEGDKAQDAKAPAKAEAKPKPELKEINLCGKLKCMTAKDNAGKELKAYVLVEKSGKKVKLPGVKAEDVEALADKDVDVVAKGLGSVVKEVVSVKACEHAAKTEAAPSAAAPTAETPAAAPAPAP